MNVNSSINVYAKNGEILVFLLFFITQYVAKQPNQGRVPKKIRNVLVSSFKITIITNSVTVDTDENQHPHYTMMIILMFSLGGETNTHVWPKRRPSWQPRIICLLLKNLLEQCTAA